MNSLCNSLSFMKLRVSCDRGRIMNKLFSQLGLARRAGKLAMGDEIVLKAIRSAQAYLVFVASDASPNTKKKFQNKCTSYRIPLVIGFERQELGACIGKAEQVVIAVIDHGFSMIMKDELKMISEVEYIG